jgi:hypothetical protein
MKGKTEKVEIIKVSSKIVEIILVLFIIIIKTYTCSKFNSYETMTIRLDFLKGICN